MVCLEQMDRLNRTWGRFVVQYPKLHISLSFVFVIVSAIHLRNMQIELDIRASFSPNNSRASYESRVYRQFFNLTQMPQRSFVLFSSKDNGSVLRPHHLLDVQKLDKKFSDFLKEIDPITGLRFCDPLCNLNKPFHLISEHLLNTDINGSTSNDLLIDYPMSSFQGVSLFIGMNFIGTQVADNYFAGNNSKITYVKTIVLWYFTRADTPISKRRLKEVSLELFKSGQAGKYLDNVKFEIFGDEIANAEMVRGAIEATMLMTIGFLLLLIFVTFTVYRKMRMMSKTSVPIIVFTAVLCPFLGSFAAFGLCTLLGFKIYTIMCVSPFLVQGVGVDDAFIMLHSWNQHRHIRSLRERMSLVFIHIGPSITITSLTNVFAFGIGYTTPTPQMSLFCLCTSFALFFDYILTFTFLAPIIYLCTPEPSNDPKEVALLQSNGANSTITDQSTTPSDIPVYFVRYSEFICSAWGRITMLIVLASLHSFAYYGLATMKSTFEPSKAFPSDSPLANSMIGVRSAFNEFFPINILVNRPPEISNTTDRALFYKMVGELEQLPESYGKNRTLLWLRAYEKMDEELAKALDFFGFKYRPSYSNVDFFLEQVGNPPTIRTSKANGTTKINSFQFSIITKEMAEWSNRAATEEKCREILMRYPEYNATIFDGDSAILDLLLTVKLDLIGSMAVTVVCMSLVCSIFIHNHMGAIIVAFTIGSVCFALVGILSWLGLDLDPVTMVDVLLATGFSVDFTAHVTHQFYAKKGTKVVKLAQSLHEMSAPMIQAGFSTVLCMLPLVFVPTYAIVAFAKTVFVVVGIGLLHGLFCMPVAITWLPESYGDCRRKPRELPIDAINANSINSKEAILFKNNNTALLNSDSNPNTGLLE